MKSAFVVLAALAALTAYYVYLPLPSTVSDPWQLMALDATFRTAQHLCNLIHYMRLSHHLRALNYMIGAIDKLEPPSQGHLKITDTLFDGVEVRVFEPATEQGEALRRSVVYIHGGGWALTSAKSSLYNNLCRTVAESLNAVVVSVDYRLVPDVHFPEQFHDAVRATKYFLRSDVLAKYSVDPDRIAISGDSAGGNLAAAVSQQLSQDENVTNKLKLQALIYPVLQPLDFNTPSYQQNMDMPVLSRFVMVKFWIDYLNGNYDFAYSMLINNHTSLDASQATYFRERMNWTSLLPLTLQKNYKPVIQTAGMPEIVQEMPALLDVRAAPLLAKKAVLQLLPKTYILACENDVLRDDAMMYAKRLEDADVEVTLDYFEDCFHG
uniref:Neutral cholesterol ester hydrolase 1 n=1 Tax=Sphenodon punctatus TaxID=8508 RepID=A0A8D0L965_SPHPU